MKKIILILLILLCTGCKDYAEINDLAIATGMIIDYKDNKYEVTTELIINNEESEIKVFKTVSTSIEKCISEISKLSNKQVFLSHLKVLLITDNIIENDIDYYDYFLRNSKFKMNYYVYLINNEDKDKVFNVFKEQESSSLYIEKMMKYNSDIFSSSTPLSFIDLVYKRLENNLDILYPSIIIKQNNDKDNIYLENLAFFKDKKISLSEKDSINYNIITNNINETTMNFNCNDKDFSLTLKNINTKYKFKENIFYIDINLDSTINSYDCKENLDKNNTIKNLNSISSKQIKKDIENTINLSKEYNYDFLGLGNYIYKHDTNYYNKWNKDLNNIKIDISINNHINSKGEIRK